MRAKKNGDGQDEGGGGLVYHVQGEADQVEHQARLGECCARITYSDNRQRPGVTEQPGQKATMAELVNYLITGWQKCQDRWRSSRGR